MTANHSSLHVAIGPCHRQFTSTVSLLHALANSNSGLDSIELVVIDSLSESFLSILAFACLGEFALGGNSLLEGSGVFKEHFCSLDQDILFLVLRDFLDESFPEVNFATENFSSEFSKLFRA